MRQFSRPCENVKPCFSLRLPGAELLTFCGIALTFLRHQYYTPVKSYYSLMKIAVDDPNFDRKKAMKKLINFAQSNPRTIGEKARMMMEHFHTQVFMKGKISGQASPYRSLP